MQEYIINGLLVVVALLAVILQIIGTRPTAGMTKKQKVMLWRILTATVLLLILQVLGAGAFEVFGAAGRWIRLAVFMVDYLVIGYDILEKAGKGIRNDLQFNDGALEAIAEEALKRDTGARALRAIIEEFMLDIMYEVPKDDNIGRVTITREYIEHRGGPVIAMRGVLELEQQD